MNNLGAFTWLEHARRMDVRQTILGTVGGLASMELPLETWSRMLASIDEIIAAGKAKPDKARDEWEQARAQLMQRDG